MDTIGLPKESKCSSTEMSLGFQIYSQYGHYRVAQRVQVFKYRDVIRFSNPGVLAVMWWE